MSPKFRLSSLSTTTDLVGGARCAEWPHRARRAIFFFFFFFFRVPAGLSAAAVRLSARPGQPAPRLPVRLHIAAARVRDGGPR